MVNKNGREGLIEMTTAPKIAPNSKEDEMMVLGCMLTNNSSLTVAAENLEEGDFYFKEHKTIFDALKFAHKKGKPADVHLICQELKRQDTLKDVGGPAYVMSLAQYAGTSAYIEEYVDQLATFFSQYQFFKFHRFSFKAFFHTLFHPNFHAFQNFKRGRIIALGGF